MLLALKAFTHPSHENANNTVMIHSVQGEGQYAVRNMPVKPLIIVRFEKFKKSQKGTDEQEKLACMKFSRISQILWILAVLQYFVILSTKKTKRMPFEG